MSFRNLQFHLKTNETFPLGKKLEQIEFKIGQINEKLREESHKMKKKLADLREATFKRREFACKNTFPIKYPRLREPQHWQARIELENEFRAFPKISESLFKFEKQGSFQPSQTNFGENNWKKNLNLEGGNKTIFKGKEQGNLEEKVKENF